MHSRALVWIALLSVCVASLGTSASARSDEQTPVRRPARLRPRDDAAHDRGLQRVRAELLRAAATQDVQRLMPILADDVTIDFGAISKKTLPEFLASDEVKRKLFWQDLRDALRLGLARRPEDGPDTTCAPYVYAGLNPIDSESSLYAITGRHVRVRSAPSLTAPVIDVLSYNVVQHGLEAETGEVELDGGTYIWYSVVTPSHKLGWVVSKYAWEDLGKTFCFKKIAGEWKLTVITRTGD